MFVVQHSCCFHYCVFNLLLLYIYSSGKKEVYISSAHQNKINILVELRYKRKLKYKICNIYWSVDEIHRLQSENLKRTNSRVSPPLSLKSFQTFILSLSLKPWPEKRSVQWFCTLSSAFKFKNSCKTLFITSKLLVTKKQLTLLFFLTARQEADI